MSKWEIKHNPKVLESCRISGTYSSLMNALYSVNNELPGNIQITTIDGQIRVYAPLDDTETIMNDINGDKAILTISQHVPIKHKIRIAIETD